MSQEITIITMIDIEAAIHSGSLEDNIYMYDNLKYDGSKGQGTAQLTSAISGFYWKNGAQASEILLNWLSFGINSLPPTLPPTFHRDKAKLLEAQRWQKINALKGIDDSKKSSAKLQELLCDNCGKAYVRNQHNELIPHCAPILNVMGEQFTADQRLSHLSYLTPIVTNITGEAIDQGVLYPAQYGTPITVNDGWYWSASTDTNKVGLWCYTMDILLHKLIFHDGVATWEPFLFQHDAFVEVSNQAKRNGFTHAGLGVLPMFTPRPQAE